MLQDPFLFAGTIADNIRFAQPGATDEQVADVAHAVGVDRIARRFESGLLHEVREGGAGLSAGERQLISIARALLADPRILILDEATSNIDRPTEILIEQALDRLLRGRTSIIIAHRLATVRRADEILVLEHGRITQRGRFDELLAARGAVPRARDSAARRVGLRRLAVRPGDRQPAEELGERRQLRAGVARQEELVDPAEVRRRGRAQLLASLVGQLRVRDARVGRARFLADVARALEPFEQPGDARRRQQRPAAARSTRRIRPSSACDRCRSTS